MGQVAGPMKTGYTYILAWVHVYPIFNGQVAGPMKMGYTYTYMHGCMYICLSHFQGLSSWTHKDWTYIHAWVRVYMYIPSSMVK